MEGYWKKLIHNLNGQYSICSLHIYQIWSDKLLILQLWRWRTSVIWKEHKRPEEVNKVWPVRITLPGRTCLSGDAWTSVFCWSPRLSFFSGVQTPGSVWVERSDSAESPVLLIHRDVLLLFSVSLLWGKTKASSSEPDRAPEKSLFQCHFIWKS